MQELLSAEEVDQELGSLDQAWAGSVDSLSRVIEFPGFLDAVRFVDRIAPDCEAMNHHPDISISWRTVTLILRTHSAGGVTAADFALARIIDRAVGELI
ncbi:MAG: 4a-hydroxytetrahydrobiopterin dehydratase [Actinomycetota bacterium]|nr:MAG: 4a-hydroxytetrahydrobiopterin dehydratase [Actinomycetota bacterium]